jgi:hypothetical protein
VEECEERSVLGREEGWCAICDNEGYEQSVHKMQKNGII